MSLYRNIPFFSGFEPRKSVTVRPDIKYVGFQMYRVSDTVRSTHGQDGAIVLDIRQGQMFNLNLVGSRILDLLKNGANELVIVDEISREFQVTHDVVDSDVRDFVQSLKGCHLVEEQDSTVMVNATKWERRRASS